MKNTFIMFVGLPGTGKSTFIEDNKTFLLAMNIPYAMASDEIISMIAEHKGKTYSEVFDSVIDLATNSVEIGIKLESHLDRNILLDQTNLSKKSRQRKINLLTNKDNYDKIAVVFECDENTLNQRLTDREKHGKIIPKSVMKRMIATFEYPTVDEGFDKVMTADEFYKYIRGDK